MEKPVLKLTKTYHTEPYPAISPLRPELSQAGKTVLITGGSTGIGYSIARGFIKAGASKVIIAARRPDVLSDAAASLSKEAEDQGRGTTVLGLQCDLDIPMAIEYFWNKLAELNTHIDVLVLNAGIPGPVAPLLELGANRVWDVFNVNVRAQIDFTERFYKQKTNTDKPKYLVHVSTMSIHNWATKAAAYPAYGLTKNAGALALQVIAQDLPPEKFQILSFHPGAIFTQSAERVGITRDMFKWDDVDLPSHFAVWAASPEAAFLHGRFVWAHWDVDELKSGEVRKRIDEDPFYLKIGVKGL